MKKVSTKNTSLITVVFIALIFIVPSFWIAQSDHQQSESLFEGRPLKRFALDNLGFGKALNEFSNGEKIKSLDLLLKLVLNRSIPIQIERAASDQFPFRNQFVQIRNFAARNINNLVYCYSSDPAIPATINSSQNTYILRDWSGFIVGPDRFDEAKSEAIDLRIANYQELVNLNKNVNFYIYYIESIESSPYNPLTSYVNNADVGQSFRYFQAHKPAGLVLDTFELDSFSDYQKYFYRTDHHWNIHGALRGYDDIYQMLSSKYPEISPRHQYKDFITFPGIEFIGQRRRSSIYPIIGEVFEVVDFKLPPYKTYQDGQEGTYVHSADYFAGNYSIDPFVDHYAEFFGRNLGFVEFVFENQTDQNLLVIGDSFDNPILPLLASHYHHTYSVDLRSSKDFSLGAFLCDHKVDDIVIIGRNDVAFESSEWFINP